MSKQQPNSSLDATVAKAAAEVETLDVAPVNARGNRQLYASRKRIHPKRARGDFRQVKWAVMIVTLGIYYLAPWLRWDRGPNAPDQAILIDLPARRFYFFFIEIWPQEVYYITGLLILAAIGLFLFTALLGRVWCGYSCPQTVWVDLFLVVERFFEGDRNARIKLDRTPWTLDKWRRKIAKHAVWLAIGVLTGGAWVFYFADAPTLLSQLVHFDAPFPAYLFIGIFTATTYVLGGFAREQVCTYMCPWPRIQSALIDQDSLLVTYDRSRGEPRGPHRRGESWEGRGHCVNCNQCVAACPMGIDIRDGLQLECIQCALCIDACNEVMAKVDLPRGLISYTTIANQKRRAQGEPDRLRILRPRVLLYTAMLILVSGIMLYAFVTRPVSGLNVLPDRNPLYVTLSDGGIRNGYTLKVINKLREERAFRLAVVGLPDPVTITGLGIRTTSGTPVIDVPPDALRAVRIFVAVPRTALADKSTRFDFVLTDLASGGSTRHTTQFNGPEP
ncbi:MAG TPA: cytochrome c oxidase accessory protein CcoG [Alphaproteobacteria bacterium]|nr:cytochrome c oxidase accessory protein CcoG [Alphaproteobacteria bacterium]HAM48394.1 cytochrome c oxidase accessory protein CcoG [Alphaproteobacteria bacterium]HCO92177.1 cytochrome c oxidase accessory protein CcoG [Alphaproteobacteria bacterium]